MKCASMFYLYVSVQTEHIAAQYSALLCMLLYGDVVASGWISSLLCCYQSLPDYTRASKAKSFSGAGVRESRPV